MRLQSALLQIGPIWACKASKLKKSRKHKAWWQIVCEMYCIKIILGYFLIG